MMASVESAWRSRAAPISARHGADAECGEHQAIDQRPPAEQLLGHQRHQCHQPTRAGAEYGAAQQHRPDGRRHRHVADTGRHGDAERLARMLARGAIRAPAGEHHDQRDIAHGIDRECRGRARRRDDRAADRRADAARHVEAQAVERDRARQFRARHHVADRCLPGRRVEGRAAADQEGEQSSIQGVITPAQAQAARAAEVASMKHCAPSMTTRRSRLSASAPAASESSMNGSVTDA